MYYRLNGDYEVCSFRDTPCVLRNRKTNEYTFYSSEIPRILFQCNGKTDVDPEGLTEARKDFLTQALESGMITQSEQPDPMEGPIPVRYYANRFRKSVHWSVTGRCNYKCKHCFQSAPDGVLGEPTTEQVLDIIRQFRECGIHEVEITGGEPLIRRDWWRIVDALIEADINIGTIYSNGRLIDQELLDGLKARGLHPGFQISFDGVGYHDWFRGVPGAEKVALGAMKLLKDNGYGFGCAMCICTNNMHTISETAKRLAEVGCGGVKVSRASVEGAWKNHTDLNIEDDDLLELYLRYIDEYYEQQIPIPVQLEGIASLIPADRLKNGEKAAGLLFDCEFNEEQTEHFLICGILEHSFFVGPNGSVVPCMSMCGAAIESQFPNLFDTPLREILSESCYTRMSEAKAADLIRANEKCVHCEYRLQCIGGRCRPAAIGEDGTDYFKASDFVCYLYKSEWYEKLKNAAMRANERIEAQRGGEKNESGEERLERESDTDQ